MWEEGEWMKKKNGGKMWTEDFKKKKNKNGEKKNEHRVACLCGSSPRDK